MKVLIADDLESNRKLIRASIKAQGYEIQEVETGRAALDVLLTTTEPIVGLIDWEMPDLDGVEVCRQAQQRTEVVPLFLILVTIRDSRQDIITGLEVGANDYITKPFDYAELLARVKIGVKMVELQQRQLTQNIELKAALDRVKLLSGLLPICAYCKNIRDEENNWEKVETYVIKHSEASFTHGICPECYKREFDQLEKLKGKGE